MRRIRFRRLDCTREFRISINRNQGVLITFCRLQQRTGGVHSDEVEWTGGCEQLNWSLVAVPVTVPGATYTMCNCRVCVIGHVRPELVASDRIIHSPSAWMPCDWRVMNYMQDRLAQP